MKKLLLVLPVVVVLLSLVAAATVSAGDCGCGCDAGCSPGFWKNHTAWMTDPDFDPGDWGSVGYMYDILWAKGNEQELFQFRYDVTDYLNHAYPYAPCHD
jgi:hypothetical protein